MKFASEGGNAVPAEDPPEEEAAPAAGVTAENRDAEVQHD